MVTIVGARPQFIKAAVVSNALREHEINELLVHTGQHFDENMSKVFFEEMGISKPHVNLGISGGTHGSMTGEMLIEVEKLIIEQKPDWVLVYGDTNSTLAGSLAASKLNIPCAHVEAGLRSDNRMMPEEINRILTDHASDLLFSPTEVANQRLLFEGIAEKKIVRTGDVMLDAALTFGKVAQERSTIIKDLALEEQPFALCTLHRAENVDRLTTFEWILEELNQVSKTINLVLPLHPRTKAKLEQFSLFKKLSSNIKLIEPVGFLDVLSLQQSSSIIITDSGGMQKEAFFQRKACVTVRTETEWVELLNGGHNRLAKPFIDKISVKVAEALNASLDWSVELYGDGQSSKTIAKALLERST
ncbi:MAG: UDP-N-acetylglucosamine 2-epimerase (non-hydrolyzing) [Verrucomicrobiota bacterium]|nr:UDP-N-acetylglucosamine 2-epimerase (non-hydrolyzing) [Verrucomicrobiota bacterium]